MAPYIRPACMADSPSLSKICLLTGNYGTSAEHLVTKPELYGLVWAVPYVHMPGCFGFVLVDRDEASGREEVVGYILGAEDTQAYEAELEELWWPELRTKYPVKEDGTETDKYFSGVFVKPYRTGKEVTDVYSSHFHIDILAPYQRQGWGKKLVGTAVNHLRAHGYEGMWAGIDARNNEGRNWYNRLNFRKIPSEQGEYYVMDFRRWDAKKQ